MNKKIMTALLVCAAVTASGCALPGKEAEKESVTAAPTAANTPTAVPTATPVPTATATPVPLKTIGEKQESAYEVQLKNMTGKAVRGFTIKTYEEEEFPESMLKEDVFEDGEERVLYYKPEETAQEQPGEITYEVQLTFADDTTKILHTFPFTDMKQGEICAEGDVIYLKYNSVSTKAPVSTKAAEMMAAMTPEPTATPVSVKAPDTAVQTETYQNSSQGSSNYTPSYDYDNNTGTNDENIQENETDENTGENTENDDERIEYEEDDRILMRILQIPAEVTFRAEKPPEEIQERMTEKFISSKKE